MKLTTSPWGHVQDVEELADGITLVSTASHGGIKLSADRLRQMPANEQTRDGWYEEDCEAAFVLRHFVNAGAISMTPERVDAIRRACDGMGGFGAIRMAHH